MKHYLAPNTIMQRFRNLNATGRCYNLPSTRKTEVPTYSILCDLDGGEEQLTTVGEQGPILHWDLTAVEEN